jgi:hypothetical protein
MMVQRPGFGATTAGGFANHKLESYDLEPECDIVWQNNTTVNELLAHIVLFLSGHGISPYNEDAIIFTAINEAVQSAEEISRNLEISSFIRAAIGLNCHKISMTQAQLDLLWKAVDILENVKKAPLQDQDTETEVSKSPKSAFSTNGGKQ